MRLCRISVRNVIVVGHVNLSSRFAAVGQIVLVPGTEKVEKIDVVVVIIVASSTIVVSMVVGPTVVAVIDNIVILHDSPTLDSVALIF